MVVPWCRGGGCCTGVGGWGVARVDDAELEVRTTASVIACSLHKSLQAFCEFGSVESLHTSHQSRG